MCSKLSSLPSSLLPKKGKEIKNVDLVKNFYCELSLALLRKLIICKF